MMTERPEYDLFDPGIVDGEQVNPLSRKKVKDTHDRCRNCGLWRTPVDVDSETGICLECDLFAPNIN